MAEEPTENTYVTELVKAISDVGKELGFDAEAFLRTRAGYPDVVIWYNGKTVAVIEVKRPEVSLSDPKLLDQALRYAEWYKRNKGVLFYGVHNMRYVALYRYQEKSISERRTLLDYVSKPGESNWIPALDFPLPVIPWATSIRDYKAITTNKTARENLRRFLLVLKDLLEGKTLDLSKDVIKTLRELIENAAAKGKHQFKNLYDEDTNIRKLVDQWISERGFEKPRNDEEFLKYLELMLKEQAYTFTIKLLFYLVLQSIDIDMAKKLKENVGILESANDPQFFKQVSDALFKYAIEKTGDFEEIFGTNNVDKLPIMHASLESYRNIVRYLGQIRWSNISIDVIGRVFEGLIYSERRHLLGQHYTDAKIVDLILMGVFRRKEEPAPLLDPACGSGTFLVRALAYWKTKHPEETRKKRAYELLEGCDIDKLAAMLAKVNLYIQALEYIKDQVAGGNKWYTPKIYHADFFKLNLEPRYSYVVTNPPYTRQEEMTLAYYSKDYKTLLEKAVSDIKEWDKRASIYAYFLVRGGKLLREGGGLGYIVENSWLNAEYGKPLKKWLFNNFHVNYIIESMVERWFEDADIITNIIIAEKTKPSPNSITRFIYLKRPLSEIIGEIPPASDITAILNYYERISRIYQEADECSPAEEPYIVCESNNAKIVAARRELVEKIENTIGKLGILRAPKIYLDHILSFVDGTNDKFKFLGDVLEIRRGLTTNANELFYLPSKWWKFFNETPSYLELIPASGKGNKLRIDKAYLRRLIRLEHLENQPYEVTRLPSLKKEDYVLWVEDVNAVKDPGTQAYIQWAKQLISSTKGFQTIYKKINKKDAFRLRSTSGGVFLFRNAIYEKFSIWLNRVSDAEIDERLYVGYVKDEHKNIEPDVIFALLNSVITYIGIELLGRANLGQGALDVKTVDYEKVIIPDPLKFREYLISKGLLQRFLNDVKKMMSLNPVNITSEALRPERHVIEEYIFSYLGLNSNSIKDMYRDLIELVKFRTERARRLT